jgi:hypothetical protein
MFTEGKRKAVAFVGDNGHINGVALPVGGGQAVRLSGVSIDNLPLLVWGDDSGDSD